MCKDNSITNLIMVVLLFFMFKRLHFQSGLINKVAKYIFAVFALNNTLVTCVIEFVHRSGLNISGDIIGFLYLCGMVLGVLTLCLILGGIRELLLGKVDDRIGKWLENRIVRRFS